MSDEFELTLKQLTQSALGVPKLTNENIVILHSLIDLILKKLDCKDEKVTICGFEAKCFEQLLESSKAPSLPLNDKNVEVISGKLNRLAILEEHLSDVESKLENHYEDIRKNSNMSDTTYARVNWARYMFPCEDICREGFKRQLLSSTDFNSKLQRIISVPIVKRILKLENVIDDMHSELIDSMNRFQIAFKKSSLVKQCIFEIEGLRVLIAKNYSLFSSTMDEFQNQHNAKLDKEEIPVLKRYVKDRIDIIESELKKLMKVKNTCPKDIRALKIGGSCLSCSRDGGGSGFLVCFEPVKKLNKNKELAICECGMLSSHRSTAQTLHERLLKVEREAVARQIRNSHVRKSIKFIGSTVGSYDSTYF